jgi:hypothetical protein
MKRRVFTATALATVALATVTLAAVTLAASAIAAGANPAANPAADPAPDAAANAAGTAVRVEAHSSDLLAVGLVQGGRMSIRLSRVLDNAPVHDAIVAVVLRGVGYPTVAESDGSYTLNAKDLALPGESAVEFQVTQQQQHEDLKGVLKVADVAAASQSAGSARQMWWWALNFGVCIGFLVLFSRRRKRAQN